ncbi:NAD(P)-binding protein [Tilletiaria anomala UBC 951]|uniref:NAD(P)-binding protein n=1 Tax=Tilletiaria anomala (strain ATCC 24038 / CBS 436.72 / UBC 951) TaxID=1037660 RepID=A0A066W6R3_TILAU|nr:NAD(P)-binding protein [Tilletiaria anomala UBC 951]KDN48233.1 NAD(P)-binding protein [Tilletiaria anomala UBC 951]
MLSWPEPRPYPPPAGRKTAIVTGGSQGIGKATALALALSGWNVVISGRRLEQLENTANEINSKTMELPNKRGKTMVFQGDMTVESAVKGMFELALDAFERVDLVFVNAGASSDDVPIQDVSIEVWQSIVNVNLTGSWLCAREAFRCMDGSRGYLGGRIILNGSISSKTPRLYSTPYTATKHAITGLTKSLALEGRQHNIAVSQIDIGNARTDMTASMRAGPGAMQANGTRLQEPVFDCNYAAKEVVHIAEMPLGVNVQEVTIMATAMPSYVGRG